MIGKRPGGFRISLIIPSGFTLFLDFKGKTDAETYQVTWMMDSLRLYDP
jgi:hypothetical protein